MTKKIKKKIITSNHFHNLVDQIFFIIEKNIDTYQGKNDIDCEINHNIAIINFNNNNKIIINRQESLRQIWLATQITGYHFEYIDNQWICTRTKKNFWNILSKICFNQTNEVINFII